MKTYFYFLLFVSSFCSCTVKVTSPESNKRFATHKKVAILPFEVQFMMRKYQRKEFTPEQVSELKIFMSVRLQSHLYDWLKNFSEQRPFSVDIQDPNITDGILSNAKIRFADLFSGKKDSLYNLLGVDAILVPQATFSEPFSDGVAMVLNKATEELEMKVFINDPSSEKELWSFISTHNNAPNAYHTRDVYPKPQNDQQAILYPMFALIDGMMKNFVKTFPYKAKKF